MAAFALALVPVIDAQRATAVRTLRVQVVDRDLEIPLEGARITVEATGDAVFTGPDGNATLSVQSAVPRAVVIVELIGYEPVRNLVTDFDQVLTIEMVIQGMLEAEELVVEADSIGESDAQLGSSVVVDREFIRTTAMLGVIEDVMSTVRLLPGVSYSGSFNALLSVRGGEPGSLTHVLDDFVVKYPYHWGGGISIFNPHMVDTVKLSAGVFPVRFGQATSGLMEVNTIDPSQGLRAQVSTSTSTVEGYAQVPIGSDAGLFVGSRFTNYDLVVQIAEAISPGVFEEQGASFGRVPFIYAGYLRGLYRPNPATELGINGFVGFDGIGVAAQDPDADPSSEVVDILDFSWNNRDWFVSARLRRALGERALLSTLVGFESWKATVDAEFTERGSQPYSEAFVDLVDAEYRGPFSGLADWTLVADGQSYDVDASTNFTNTDVLNHTQFRTDLDYQTVTRGLIQVGGGAFLTQNSYDTQGQFLVVLEDEPLPGLDIWAQADVDEAAPSNSQLVSFGYLGYQPRFTNPRLEAELGVRVDHGVLFGADNFTVNTTPVLGPRVQLRVALQPERLESSQISLGTGLFSQVPFEASLLNPDLDIDSIETPKSFLSVIGWEGLFANGLRIRGESYYKYLFDRFYINNSIVEDPATPGATTIENVVRTDGIGHVGGFDMVIERRAARRWDGYLSYSFIYARYRNPRTDGETAGLISDEASEPRGRWYYPPFHRFHTLNLVFNFKPTDRLTITPSLTFASGNPVPAYGDVVLRPALVYGDPANPTTVTDIYEVYSREERYDDDNRNGWTLPVNLRIAWHRTGPLSRVSREVYLAAEDILSPLLVRIAPPSAAEQVDTYTGEVTRDADQQLSFPIISIGFRVTY